MMGAAGEGPQPSAPFAALLAATGLVVAVLFVAGFSYRWTYYYNFGLQHLLFTFKPDAVVASALEVIRQPQNFGVTLLLVALGQVLAAFLVFVLRASSRLISVRLRIALADGGWGRLASDGLRAIALIYAALAAGHYAGLRTFDLHAADGPDNSLPRIVLIGGSVPEVLACDTAPAGEERYLGARPLAHRIDAQRLGCDTHAGSWRLLHSDERYVYAFLAPARRALARIRPLTLVIPRTGGLTLVINTLEGAKP